jgi:TRAP-type C4-dicarboxylate transport system substrate-binding protein
MGIITSGPFVNFVPEFGVLDMPFLFAGNAQAYKILDGAIGQGIPARLG